MTVRFILTDYMNRALCGAVYDKLADSSFSGRIAACPEVIAFTPKLSSCEEELRSTLEEWILVGLKLGHQLVECR